MMKNNLNFTEEMKEMIKGWKGKILKGYIENDDSENVTTIRFLIDDKAFDFTNDYISYEYPDGDCAELTCFSCVEVGENEPLRTTVVGGKRKENRIEKKIIDIYLVTDREKGKLFDTGVPYEMTYETALIIQTEYAWYVFWRNLIFYTIEIANCEDKESALKAIKSVEQIHHELQEENPYTVTVERMVQQL